MQLHVEMTRLHFNTRRISGDSVAGDEWVAIGLFGPLPLKIVSQIDPDGVTNAAKAGGKS